MNLFASIRANVALLCVLVLAGPVFAQPVADGWHTWRVPAVDHAPDLCCYRWNRGTPGQKGCDLDSGRGGFSLDGDGRQPIGELQVYAKVEDGMMVEVRALSASCPVTTGSPVNDIGEISATESIDWLDVLIDADEDVAEDAMAAIAFHDGDRPGEVLTRRGREHPDPEIRSDAWFWLAQSAPYGSEAVIRRAVHEDRDADVREDAVFALSQLPDDVALGALKDLLESRDVDMEIREQALFWLVQSDSDEAFEYIDDILSDN